MDLSKHLKNNSLQKARASAKKMIKRVFVANVIAKFIWQISLALLVS